MNPPHTRLSLWPKPRLFYVPRFHLCRLSSKTFLSSKESKLPVNETRLMEEYDEVLVPYFLKIIINRSRINPLASATRSCV